GALTRFIGEHHPVREYDLTEDVAERFGIGLGQPDVMEFHREAGWLVTSHDEHWRSLYPVSEPLLRRVLVGVLQQLSFLVKHDLAEADIVAKLMPVLRAWPALKFDARPGKGGGETLVKVGVEPPSDQRTLLERAMGCVWLLPFRTIGRIDRQGAL